MMDHPLTPLVGALLIEGSLLLAAHFVVDKTEMPFNRETRKVAYTSGVALVGLAFSGYHLVAIHPLHPALTFWLFFACGLLAVTAADAFDDWVERRRVEREDYERLKTKEQARGGD